MSAVNFLIGSMLAEREGADERGRQLAGVLTYTMGLTPVGLMMTIMMARREAESTPTSNGAGSVTVPATAKATPADATDALKAAGLGVSTTTIVQPSDTVPKDHVIGTQPGAGTKATLGLPVKLIISSGSMSVPK